MPDGSERAAWSPRRSHAGDSARRHTLSDPAGPLEGRAAWPGSAAARSNSERGGPVSVDTRHAGSAGTVGDRYRLLECVAGDPDGPAVAWRAWDDVLNRPVTLTVVRPGGPAADGFLAHAHAVSAVTHPSLARVWDAVDEGDRAYVVSEWVTGTPFTALLRDGALDAESAAGTVARVADGVAAAHGGRRRVRRRAPRPRGRHRHRRGQAGPGRRRRPGRGHRRRARPRCPALRRAHRALAARPDRRRRGAAPGHHQQRPPALPAPGPGRRARGPVQPGRPRSGPGLAQRGALGRRDGQRARRPGGHAAPDDVFGLDQDGRAQQPPALAHARPAGRRRPDRAGPAAAGWSAPRSAGCPASATTTTSTASAGTPTRTLRPRRPLVAIQPTGARLYDPDGDGQEARGISRRHRRRPGHVLAHRALQAQRARSAASSPASASSTTSASRPRCGRSR